MVEDHPEYREIVELALGKESDMELISQFGTAERALRSFQERRGDTEPDVILLDLNLPKRSGLEVLEHIKGSEYLRMIPVVILTTSDAEKDRISAYGHHVNSYLVKPVDFDQFKKIVDDLGYYWGVCNNPALR